MARREHGLAFLHRGHLDSGLDQTSPQTRRPVQLLGVPAGEVLKRLLDQPLLIGYPFDVASGGFRGVLSCVSAHLSRFLRREAFDNTHDVMSLSLTTVVYYFGSTPIRSMLSSIRIGPLNDHRATY